jgi:hypothetical protein
MKNNQDGNTSQDSQLIIYQTEDGLTKIDVAFDGDIVWLTQAQMVELFQSSKANISEHISHVFEEGELVEDSVVRKFRTTAADGKSYNTNHYNLDVIISVGYRVKSLRGTQFRIWASKILKEYLIKGFAMNDDILMNNGGGAYFDELLERIRNIRSSEKVFWRKVLDIYATSVDYDPNTEASVLFFKTVQNKMHWAAHGQTAAEKIFYSADSEKPNMGIQVFRGQHPTESEALIAKNYCSAEELDALNSVVSAYLEFAEMQARRRIPMHMGEWIETLDGFLKLSRHNILTNAGSISALAAEKKARAEYKKFQARTGDQLTSAERDYIKALETMEQKLTGGDAQ